MQSGQGKIGGVVVKAGRLFPGFKAVAAPAVTSELAAMHILMAAATLRPEPQKRPRQVLYPDHASLCRVDEPGLMALRARQASVLALEHIARLGVIEIFAPSFPFDDIQLAPVMLGVAAHAIG